MFSAKMTSNGRITIPVRVLKALGIEIRDLVEFFELDRGAYVVLPKIPLGRLKGLIPKPAKPVSIEDMNAAIVTSRSR